MTATGRTAITSIAAAMLWAQTAVVDRAWDLLARDKRAEAVSLLRGAIQSAPSDADARLLLGSLLAEAGETAEAIAHLRAGVRLRPGDAMAHNALGEALSDAGDTAPARAAFQKAVDLNGEFAQARENLGLVLLDAGEVEGAAGQLDRAIALFGDTEASAYARYLRARVHMQLGEIEEAEKQLSRAVALRPQFPEAWSDLGQAREKLGNDAGALTALQQAVRVDPNGAVALTRLGSLYLQLGKAADAIPHLERAARLSPDNQTTLNSLQLALRAAGNTARADEVKAQLAAIFRKRDRDSQNALAAVKLNNDGAELEKQGKIAAAVNKYREAVQLNPGHAGIRANYAIALLRLGRWEQGLDELRAAVRQDPSNEKLQQALHDALAQAPASVRNRQ